MISTVFQECYILGRSTVFLELISWVDRLYFWSSYLSWALVGLCRRPLGPLRAPFGVSWRCLWASLGRLDGLLGLSGRPMGGLWRHYASNAVATCDRRDYLKAWCRRPEPHRFPTCPDSDHAKQMSRDSRSGQLTYLICFELLRFAFQFASPSNLESPQILVCFAS